MGIEWRLSLVDHDHVVERGFPLLSSANRSGLLDDVRVHLRSKPWEANTDLVTTLERMVASLTELNAPEILLSNARQRLSEARGEHVTEAGIRDMGFRTARRVLRSWNMSQRVYCQGSRFDLIHWAVDPQRRARAEEAVLEIGETRVIEPHWRLYPDLEPTVWDHTYYGSADIPTDFDGIPLGGGSLFGSYNPPSTVRVIRQAISATRLPPWPAIVKEYTRSHPWIAGKLVGDLIEKELQSGWEQTRQAYETAMARGFGVLIEADD
jgi:hypothetical protein